MDESIQKQLQGFGNLAVASPDTVQVQEPGKALRLSEAIRIGAKLRPQAFETMFDGLATCALGAAHEGIFGEPPPKDSCIVGCGALERHFGVSDELTDKIMGMNDRQRKSREQIADWLESQGY